MNTRNIIILLTAIFILNSPTVFAEKYKALIRCGFQENYASPVICLSDSELKITKNNRAKIYNILNITTAGEWYKDALVISLPENFYLEINNSDDLFILEVKIIDEDGNIFIEDQAGKFSTISIKN